MYIHQYFSKIINDIHSYIWIIERIQRKSLVKTSMFILHVLNLTVTINNIFQQMVIIVKPVMRDHSDKSLTSDEKPCKQETTVMRAYNLADI